MGGTIRIHMTRSTSLQGASVQVSSQFQVLFANYMIKSTGIRNRWINAQCEQPVTGLRSVTSSKTSTCHPPTDTFTPRNEWATRNRCGSTFHEKSTTNRTEFGQMDPTLLYACTSAKAAIRGKGIVESPADRPLHQFRPSVVVAARRFLRGDAGDVGGRESTGID